MCLDFRHHLYLRVKASLPLATQISKPLILLDAYFFFDELH